MRSIGVRRAEWAGTWQPIWAMITAIQVYDLFVSCGLGMVIGGVGTDHSQDGGFASGVGTGQEVDIGCLST